ncbi:Hypothetical predicted protein [Olea europaea subsp. europaea]|uniref:Uncharacterized protein n=1 Tax=Olea europaea subsp. europaea TaxID=158383 RepID=A0A8S0PGC2_OLEEU|nr:Hypothetical predicted protein [Olea europaea subsp. europaea]
MFFTSLFPLVRIRGFVKNLGIANFRPPCSLNHSHRLPATTRFIRVASKSLSISLLACLLNLWQSRKDFNIVFVWFNYMLQWWGRIQEFAIAVEAKVTSSSNAQLNDNVLCKNGFQKCF